MTMMEVTVLSARMSYGDIVIGVFSSWEQAVREARQIVPRRPGRVAGFQKPRGPGQEFASWKVPFGRTHDCKEMWISTYQLDRPEKWAPYLKG